MDVDVVVTVMMILILNYVVKDDMHLFMHSFIHAFIYSCIHLFMHSFMQSFMHACIHLFIPLWIERMKINAWKWMHENENTSICAIHAQQLWINGNVDDGDDDDFNI